MVYLNAKGSFGSLEETRLEAAGEDHLRPYGENGGQSQLSLNYVHEKLDLVRDM